MSSASNHVSNSNCSSALSVDGPTQETVSVRRRRQRRNAAYKAGVLAAREEPLVATNDECLTVVPAGALTPDTAQKDVSTQTETGSLDPQVNAWLAAYGLEELGPYIMLGLGALTVEDLACLEDSDIALLHLKPVQFRRLLMLLAHARSTQRRAVQLAYEDDKLFALNNGLQPSVRVSYSTTVQDSNSGNGTKREDQGRPSCRTRIFPCPLAGEAENVVIFQIVGIHGNQVGDCSFLRKDCLQVIKWRIFDKLQLFASGIKNTSGFEVAAADGLPLDNRRINDLCDTTERTLTIVFVH